MIKSNYPLSAFGKSSLLLLIFVLFSSTGFLYAQHQEIENYEYDYHTYQETTDLLQALADHYPELSELYSIGKSATGTKELWVMEIGNKNNKPASEKPAVYFDGNQHNTEAMAGEVTLHLVHYLLTNYGHDPKVTELVDTRVIYVLVLGDPDGAEWYITGEIDWDPSAIPNAGFHYDEGKSGLDGPADITGNGEILTMRVEDPDGEWKTYEKEPRLMVRRDFDESDGDGPFYRLYQEGIDSNEDGEINSDPPHVRFITNRNFPAFWSSTDASIRGAGNYPLDEPNSRHIVDFLYSKPHVSQIESFHTTSGVHLRPFAARPDEEIPPMDREDYNSVLRLATEITSYPQASVYHQFTTLQEGLSPDEQPGARRGVFIDWAYSHYGAFATTTELWTLEPFVNEIGWGEIPRDEPLFAIPGRYNRPDIQARVLQWLDKNEGNPDLSGQGFVDWEWFEHPDLGDVEIGGFTRYWMRNPPPGPYYKEVATDQAKFAVVRSLKTPLVKIRDVEINQNSDGSWYVRAKAVNEGYLDTSMQHARNAGLARADRLSIKNIDSDVSIHEDETIEFEFMRGTRGGSFESFYYGSWTIDAPAGTELTITIDSEKGGVDRKSIVLE